MKLVPISRERRAIEILYDLLKERTPEMSISHQSMPTFEEHTAFVRSTPYFYWALINVDGDYVGSVYISKTREIGVFVFEKRRGKGYGEQAVRELMQRWPGKFLANIAPTNPASRRFFEKLGFTHIQDTLCHTSSQK
jgi:RimJ/RimL family protein N-acetyltransferase